jgi:hypothetical protein
MNYGGGCGAAARVQHQWQVVVNHLWVVVVMVKVVSGE